jgi:hypothetical protein
MTLCLFACSVMAVRLRALNAELLRGGAGLWRAQAEQHLLQSTALARFFSYLAFAFAEGKQKSPIQRIDMISAAWNMSVDLGTEAT